MNKTLLSYALALAGAVSTAFSGDVYTVPCSLEKKVEAYSCSRENMPYATETELHYSVFARRTLTKKLGFIPIPIPTRASGEMMVYTQLEDEHMDISAKSKISITAANLWSDDSKLTLDSKVRLSDFRTLSSRYLRSCGNDPADDKTDENTKLPENAKSNMMNLDPISFMYLVRNNNFKLELDKTIPVLCTYRGKITQGSLSNQKHTPKLDDITYGCTKYVLQLPGHKLPQVDVYIQKDTQLPVYLVQHLLVAGTKMRVNSTLKSVKYNDGQIRKVYK